MIEMKSTSKYEKIRSQSGKTNKFAIIDEVDDIIEDDTTHNSSSNISNNFNNVDPKNDNSLCSYFTVLWKTLAFSWMEDLLRKGNERPLETNDLYALGYRDSSEGVYQKFKRGWGKQLETNDKPSLTMTFVSAFGTPFMLSGLLKFINDSCMFIGPLLLNRIIHYLNDPYQPLQIGLLYVFGLFISNLLMSLCLRQYFWWCYRVGMNLRSSVVTAVYHKSLVISAAALSRKTVGEITNLMSVDSSRLQDLTPYLHAVWYSLYQISIAMFLLWNQVGASCFAGMLIIILTIPLTSKVSMYMKSLQKELSTVRDERIKLTNEVLNGMKVIKLQAWESELENRVKEVRTRELQIFRKYSISQALSGVLYTSIPLLVSVITFATYIYLGNMLDTATALTSLALFDLLRFPLFMLPQVLNNVIEAKVSIDRVQNYLLESEKVPVPSFPLRNPGVQMKKTTLIWESAIKAKNTTSKSTRTAQQKTSSTLIKYLRVGLAVLTCNTCGDRNALNTTNSSDIEVLTNSQHSLVKSPLQSSSRTNSTSSLDSSSTISTNTSSKKTTTATNATTSSSSSAITEAELVNIVRDAQIVETERTIDELEIQLAKYQQQQQQVQDNSTLDLVQQQQTTLDGLDNDEDYYEEKEEDHGNYIIDSDGNSTAVGRSCRVLTLSRITLKAELGQLISIVGPVGSGKSSMLSALLGDMRCCYGSVSVYGTMAYAAQIPFIQNSTLKDNILYGNSFNEYKYEETLRRCALLPDIKVLPAGHETEIGERGINLSGGQKARVGLARAVYADTELYLLDDPLSAVDAHVGQHLFEQCILNLKQKGKCVVLVTNALQFVKSSTRIIVLKDGRIDESGTYEQLLHNKRGFTEMITTMNDTSSSKSSIQSSSLSPSKTLIRDRKETILVSNEPQETKHNSTNSPLHDVPLVKEDNTLEVSEHTILDSKVSIKKSASIITVEDMEQGEVGVKVYSKWATAAGGISVAESITVITSWWLTFWSENRDALSPWFYLRIYTGINMFLLVIVFIRDFYLRLRCLDASAILFSELLGAILYSPMAFFDTTPLGRIINRFSKDIYTIDEQIPITIRGYAQTMVKVCITLLYIVIILPFFMIGLVPVFIFYYYSQKYYIKTSRELTRLESTSRSPIYALFSETLDGLSTIRAYRSEPRLIAKNNYLLDQNVKSYFLNFSANCWLAVRLEFVGTLIVTFTALFAVLARDTHGGHGPVDATEYRQTFAGLAGLSISFALSVTQSLNWTVRMASDLESQMISVERVKAYSTMEQEAPHFIDSDPLTINKATTSTTSISSSSINTTWPSNGSIVMKNVAMRYRDGLPLVLKGLTLTINGHEKIGIVGRTGAGKSSLLTALLRLVELESGSIIIDGIDISTLGLNTLRSVMAIIPQDPVLFSGTIRSNLDPFNKYSDMEIWEGLQRTLLSNAISSLTDKVTENGSNFSVGQRQLLCITRALLLRAKIIIMDEATAAVDVETDAAIQQTIRTEFAHATCLTVAHRLNTIMDSDKVLVMDQGVVGEFDTPANLLANPNTMFSKLVTNWEKSH